MQPPAIDPASYTRFAQESTRVRHAADYRALLQGPMRELLPHGMAYSCTFRMHFGQVEIHRLLGVNFPAGFLEQAPMVFKRDERRAAFRWLDTRRPVYLTPESGDDLLSPLMRSEMALLDAQACGFNGMLDLSSNMGSFHGFFRLDRSLPRTHVEHLLELACPLLHQAFARLADVEIIDKDPLADLTPIERELLGWIAAGRTNRQIAELRGRSESTVRNQLEVLYRKLGANNRAEVSRIAVSAGLTFSAPPADGTLAR